jgi:hypothetical protein
MTDTPNSLDDYLADLLSRHPDFTHKLDAVLADVDSIAVLTTILDEHGITGEQRIAALLMLMEAGPDLMRALGDDEAPAPIH